MLRGSTMKVSTNSKFLIKENLFLPKDSHQLLDESDGWLEKFGNVGNIKITKIPMYHLLNAIQLCGKANIAYVERTLTLWNSIL